MGDNVRIKLDLGAVKTAADNIKGEAARVLAAVNRAIKTATPRIEVLAVDHIFQRFGFRFRSYIAERFSSKVDQSGSVFGLTVTARGRATTLQQFEHEFRTQPAKSGGTKGAGIAVQIKRGSWTYFPRAFVFLGRSGNLISAVRPRGGKGRKIGTKGDSSNPSPYYGIPVSGAFLSMIREHGSADITQILQDEINREINK